MKRRHSIWMKIVALPLIWVFLAILLLSFASVYVGYTRTLDQKRLAGLAVAQQFRNRLAERSRAITALEEVLERTALNAAQVAAAEYAEVSDELLTETAQKLGVSVLNWYDPSGTVIYSAFQRHLGRTAAGGYLSSGEESLVWPLCLDAESGDYYIYAFQRARGGSVVQAGVVANELRALQEELGSGQLVVDATSGATLSYANVFNAQGELEAASPPVDEGQLFQDGAKLDALRQKSNYVALTKHPLSGETVWDILLPVYAQGDYAGAVNVGVNLEIVGRTVRSSIILTLLIAGSTYLVLGLLLSVTASRLVSSINGMSRHIDLVAGRVLHQGVPGALLGRKDEIGLMAKGVQAMQDAFNSVLTKALETAAATARASHELSASSEETSASIEEVAGTANEFASTVEAMGGSVTEMVQAAEGIQASAAEGQSVVGRTVTLAHDLRENMAELAEAVTHLGERSEEIGQIVEAITAIADQTNLLALNAAIEAARAGEYGRGFAVVAEEVRQLAEQVAGSTKQITDLVRAIQGETERTVQGIKRGAAQAEDTAAAVSRSGELLTAILRQIAEITITIKEVSRGIEMIGAGSEELAAATQQQSASMETISSAVQELSVMAERLEQLVQEFELTAEEGKD
jgi:methyl-accepting chemotaxis protein